MTTYNVYYFFNPNHDKRGRFTTAPNKSSRVVKTRRSRVHPGVTDYSINEDQFYDPENIRAERKRERLSSALLYTMAAAAVAVAAVPLVTELTRKQDDISALTALMQAATPLVTPPQAKVEAEPAKFPAQPEQKVEGEIIPKEEKEASPEVKRIRIPNTALVARPQPRREFKKIVKEDSTAPAATLQPPEPIKPTNYAVLRTNKELAPLESPDRTKAPVSIDEFMRFTPRSFLRLHEELDKSIPGQPRTPFSQLTFDATRELDKVAKSIKTLSGLIAASPSGYMEAHYGSRPNTDKLTVSKKDLWKADKHLQEYSDITSKISKIEKKYNEELGKLTATKDAESDKKFDELVKQNEEELAPLKKTQEVALQRLQNSLGKLPQELVVARKWDEEYEKVKAIHAFNTKHLMRMVTYYDTLFLAKKNSKLNLITLEDVARAGLAVQENHDKITQALTSSSPSVLDATVQDLIERTNKNNPNYISPVMAYFTADNLQAKLHKEISNNEEALKELEYRLLADPDIQVSRALGINAEPTGNDPITWYKNNKTYADAKIVAIQEVGGDDGKSMEGGDQQEEAITQAFIDAKRRWREKRKEIIEKQKSLRDSGLVEQTRQRTEVLKKQVTICFDIMDELLGRHPYMEEVLDAIASSEQLSSMSAYRDSLPSVSNYLKILHPPEDVSTKPSKNKSG